NVENYQITNAANASEWAVGFPLSNTGISVPSGSGSSAIGLSASFNDTDPAASATTDRATIAWGDGTSSSGVVAFNGQGSFTVAGSHVYAARGTYTITVTLIDSLGGAASASTTFSGGLELDSGTLNAYVNST